MGFPFAFTGSSCVEKICRMVDALGAVLAGGADSVLGEYSAARRPISQDVAAMTDRLTRLATLPRALRSAGWFTADELGAATGAEPQHPGRGAHLDQRERRRQRDDGRLLLHRRRTCHVVMHRGR